MQTGFIRRRQALTIDGISGTGLPIPFLAFGADWLRMPAETIPPMLTVETKTPDTSASSEPSGKAPPDWRGIVEPVEPFLQSVAGRLVEQVEDFDPEIAEYAHYALANQGKQLRPALVSLSASAAGGVREEHVTLAVIIEMVHLATLVHDDVMDEAEMRRKRPTLAVNWGRHVSVLLGDCLFAHALKLAASYPTPEICRAVASAAKTVCSGEILQTHRRLKFDMTRAEYFKMLAMKTAEFFALSCDLGAHLSGAGEPEREALRRYGMALGTAYQIYDDCLDLFGSEDVVGKSLGADLAGGKLTLPAIVTLERANDADRGELREVIENWRPEHLERALRLFERYDALKETKAAIARYLTEARDALSEISQGNGRDALHQLTDFLEWQSVHVGRAAGVYNGR
jgi:octaprenyl-diphosphate synthase